jgi:hypothetical protein
MMADDIPYRLETKKGGLWEMPVHWGTDDWPPFAHYSEIGYMMPVAGPSEDYPGFGRSLTQLMTLVDFLCLLFIHF